MEQSGPVELGGSIGPVCGDRSAGRGPVRLLRPARAGAQRGDVVELSASEVTQLGAGNLRALAVAGGGAGTRDQLGESYAASNASP